MILNILEGNVKRRYEVPDYNQASVKLEPNISDVSDDGDGGHVDNEYNDSDYTPDGNASRKEEMKEVRMNIVRLKSAKSNSKNQSPNAGPSSSTWPKRTRRSTNVIPLSFLEEDNNDASEDEEGYLSEPSKKNTKLTSLDSERLSELANDALERGKMKPNSNKGTTRNSCTLMQKMEVIRMTDRGMKQSQISKKLKIPKSSVSLIVQSREKIEEAFQSGAPLRKRIVRKSAFADINEALYEWYEKMRTQNLYVNSRVLLTMAENIANELGRTDFIPSSNWLTRFKENYNIRFTSTPAKPKNKAGPAKKAEKDSGDDNSGGGVNKTNEDHAECSEKSEDDNDYFTKLDEVIWLRKDWLRNVWTDHRVKNRKTRETYKERDIFFVEELGILYRVTPKQAWQFKTGKNMDSLLDFSITEERLTVLLCANSDGSEKRRLLIAGKPEAVLPSNLPADYIATSDPSNWFTKSVFANWIKSWNTLLQSQNRKIILVSNSSPIHAFALKLNLSNIKIVNIPTRLLSSLHPVNFGISLNFKSRYRRLLLERLINYGGSKAVTYLDSIFIMSTAWNELPSNVIRAAFHQAGYFSCSDIPILPEDEFDCASLISKAAELDLAVPVSKYRFSVSFKHYYYDKLRNTFFKFKLYILFVLLSQEYIEIDNSLCAIDCSVTGTGGYKDTEEDDHSEEGLNNIEAVKNVVESVPTECHLTTEDAQNSLENVRLFAMSRESCPQEVHNALSTLESFLVGHT